MKIVLTLVMVVLVFYAMQILLEMRDGQDK